jgi:hypothetical protein
MAFQRKKPMAIGVKAPFPGFIEPALATSIEKAPSGDRWIHEIKFDGYRVQAHLANTEVKVFTRLGRAGPARGDRVSREIGRGQGPASILQGSTGRSVMAKDAFDRWWKWVAKPADSTLTIPAHFHGAIMQLSLQQRSDRTVVNEAVRLVDPEAQR